MIRLIVSFLVAYIVASQLNWGIAELILNDWAAPRLDGFLRSGDDAASGGAIVKLSVGFLVPLLAIAILQTMLERPRGWVARAVFVSMVVSIAAFYGTYTFISGYGNVNLLPLMGFATADTICMVAGALVFGFLHDRKRS